MVNELVFKTKVGKKFTIFYAVAIAFMIFVTWFARIHSTDDFSTGLIAVYWIVFVVFLFASVVLKTVIADGFVRVKSILPLYKVPIRDITRIEKGHTMWVGFHKHGTATNGLIISSSSKNDLYITPQDEDLFINKILEMNPRVVVEKP